MRNFILIMFLIFSSFAFSATELNSFEKKANILLKQTEEFKNYKELNKKYQAYNKYLNDTLANLDKELSKKSSYQHDKMIWQKSFEQSKKTIKDFTKNKGRMGRVEAFAAENQLIRQRIEFLYSIK